MLHYGGFFSKIPNTLKMWENIDLRIFRRKSNSKYLSHINITRANVPFCCNSKPHGMGTGIKMNKKSSFHVFMLLKSIFITYL